MDIRKDNGDEKRDLAGAIEIASHVIGIVANVAVLGKVISETPLPPKEEKK